MAALVHDLRILWLDIVELHTWLLTSFTFSSSTRLKFWYVAESLLLCRWATRPYNKENSIINVIWGDNSLTETIYQINLLVQIHSYQVCSFISSLEGIDRTVTSAWYKGQVSSRKWQRISINSSWLKLVSGGLTWSPSRWLLGLSWFLLGCFWVFYFSIAWLRRDWSGNLFLKCWGSFTSQSNDQ